MNIKERYDKETSVFAYNCITRIIKVLGIIKTLFLDCISVIEIFIIILSVMFNIIRPDSGKHDSFINLEKKQRRKLVKHKIEDSGLVKNFLLRCIMLYKANRIVKNRMVIASVLFVGPT